MSLTIECECGVVVQADTEDGLVAAAHAHIERIHSAAAGGVTESDLLAMARGTVETSHDSGGRSS